ncbi:MAG: DNA polymerase IV [Actinomycetota bacterium]|nr:DNA polymerase IV [Actinomycetota bacterium]
MTTPDDTNELAPWHGRAIIHVDMDAFFAAVEQLDNPELRGKPVIVGGSPDGRGVVSTCSYEARRFGVRSAMPSARAARLCPGAIWVRPHFERYSEISHAVREIFESMTPQVQPVSIDEAFLDVTPGAHSPLHPVEIAREIRERVAELGVTCSAGLASSKTIAKIASDFEKPNGLTVVQPGDEAAFLAPLAIEVMSGIGPKTAARLRTSGVATLGDLARLDDPTAEDILGSHGLDLVRRARGIDPRPVHDNDPRKSISAERTFAEDLREAPQIRDAIDRLAERVGRRLRKAGVAGRTLSVKVRFSDFTTRGAQRTLSVPADADPEIARVAWDLVRGLWSPGVGVRLLGVGLSGFDESAQQLDLLGELEAESSSPERAKRLVTGLDAVRERFGEDAVGFGVRGIKSPRRTDIAKTASDGAEDSEQGSDGNA